MNKENIEQVLELQSENYLKRIGTEFGTFRINDIKYNWTTRTQEWTICCIKCGNSEVVPGSVGRDWMRGKGRRRDKCKNCINIEKEMLKTEKSKKADEKEHFLNSYIGKSVCGWMLFKRENSRYEGCCPVCGRNKKNIPLKKIENNDIVACTHSKNFSSEEYIGNKYGNLTVIKHINGEFLVRCDCGFEKTVKCSAVYNGKTTTCGRIECEYHNKAMNYLGKHGNLVRQVGEETEKDIYEYLTTIGYSVQQTKTSGDYGVDLICIGRDGSKVAIQIKNNSTTKAKTGVHAVMEVYSGGIFYDCNKFAVISYTGYTDNAKQMADKLGVMLCNERCELFDFTKQFHHSTKHTWIVNGKEEPMLKTFKENNWDANHLKRFSGMNYEQVKDYFDNRTRRQEQLKTIKEKGFSPQFVKYRMEINNMTFEQAISEPKHQGRPSKQEVSA